MNATEILAVNLRRLKASDRLTDYRDTGWLEIALEGRGGSLNVFAIEHLASMLGVEPWQLLAPLCGRAAWSPNPSGSLSLRTLPDCGRVGSIMVYTHTVMSEVPGRDPVMAHHATEAEARAAVEAALFEGEK